MTQDLFCEPENLRDTVIHTRNASSDTTRQDVSWTEAVRDKATSPDEAFAIEREGLRQRVRLFLATSNIPTLRHVDVEIEGDAVLLRGKVRSYYEKQMALQFTSQVAGVIQVVDSIEVRAYVPVARLGALIGEISSRRRQVKSHSDISATSTRRIDLHPGVFSS